MQYKYTIVQENVNDKNKVSFEFAAMNEEDFLENISSFMKMIGWNDCDRLEVVTNNSIYDNVDNEVREYDLNYRNPDVEGFMNFEFPITPTYDNGGGQMDYSFTTSDTDSLASTWPFPADRPSQPTYRVDSIYTKNDDEPSYYGA